MYKGGLSLTPFFKRLMRVAVSLYAANAAVRVGFSAPSDTYVPAQNVARVKQASAAAAATGAPTPAPGGQG